MGYSGTNTQPGIATGQLGSLNLKRIVFIHRIHGFLKISFDLIKAQTMSSIINTYVILNSIKKLNIETKSVYLQKEFTEVLVELQKIF